MFASYSAEHETFTTFERFLEQAIAGNTKYVPYVNRVLDNAHRLCRDRNAILGMDAPTLSIVIYLSETQEAFFNNLNVAQITGEEYQKVLVFLKEKELVFE